MRTSVIAVPFVVLALLAMPLVGAHSCDTSGNVSYDVSHSFTCLGRVCSPGHLCIQVLDGIDPRLLP